MHRTERAKLAKDLLVTPNTEKKQHNKELDAQSTLQLTKAPKKPRPKALFEAFIAELEAHLQALKVGKSDFAYTLEQMAVRLHVTPGHLSNSVREVTGASTCDFYEEGLLRIAKELLTETSLSAAEIARRLTYDPSNFGKFFKSYTGLTPIQFRKQSQEKISVQNESPELLTMIA